MYIEEDRWNISGTRRGQTDAATSTGTHGKHDGVGVGGAVKREIRVHPEARFSIVRSRSLPVPITMEIDLAGRRGGS